MAFFDNVLLFTILIILGLAIAFFLGAVAPFIWDGQGDDKQAARDRIRQLMEDPALATSPDLQAELQRLKKLIDSVED